eukprot:6197137-Pleurochrysis_carterae.AAC.1
MPAEADSLPDARASLSDCNGGVLAEARVRYPPTQADALSLAPSAAQLAPSAAQLPSAVLATASGNAARSLSFVPSFLSAWARMRAKLDSLSFQAPKRHGAASSLTVDAPPNSKLAPPATKPARATCCAPTGPSDSLASADCCSVRATPVRAPAPDAAAACAVRAAAACAVRAEEAFAVLEEESLADVAAMGAAAAMLAAASELSVRSTGPPAQERTELGACTELASVMLGSTAE